MLNMFRTLILEAFLLYHHIGCVFLFHSNTHIETRTHNQCGDTIEKLQAPDDGCINVRNMLSIEEVK